MIHVDEVLASMRHAHGEEWDGFATGLDGARLYHWLCPLSNGAAVRLGFSSPHAFYSEAFFAVLFSLAGNDQETEWFASVLDLSDLAADRELVRLARTLLNEEPAWD